MLTVRTSENTVITSFRLISERQDFSSVRTGENTVRARARIHSHAASGTRCSHRYEEQHEDLHLEDSASFPLVLPSDDIVYMFLLWGIEDFSCQYHGRFGTERLLLGAYLLPAYPR